jgi:hypothetical protein
MIKSYPVRKDLINKIVGKLTYNVFNDSICGQIQNKLSRSKNRNFYRPSRPPMFWAFDGIIRETV